MEENNNEDQDINLNQNDLDNEEKFNVDVEKTYDINNTEEDEYSDIQEDRDVGSINKKEEISNKNSLNDFDLKGNTKKAYSYIISTTKDVSLNIYKNVNENMKKVNWSGILKSIINVIVCIFQLIFNSIMYLKDKTQKQYKLKINRDILTLKKEKNTVFGIIIFIVLVILIYHFFF